MKIASITSNRSLAFIYFEKPHSTYANTNNCFHNFARSGTAASFQPIWMDSSNFISFWVAWYQNQTVLQISQGHTASLNSANMRISTPMAICRFMTIKLDSRGDKHTSGCVRIVQKIIVKLVHHYIYLCPKLWQKAAHAVPYILRFTISIYDGVLLRMHPRGAFEMENWTSRKSVRYESLPPIYPYGVVRPKLHASIFCTQFLS